MAQCNNQKLVNSICHPLSSVEIINECFDKAYFRKRKDACFLIVCNILASVISDTNFDVSIRTQAWGLLKQRYDQIDSDFEYRKANFLLAADYEYALNDHINLNS